MPRRAALKQVPTANVPTLTLSCKTPWEIKRFSIVLQYPFITTVWRRVYITLSNLSIIELYNLNHYPLMLI